MGKKTAIGSIAFSCLAIGGLLLYSQFIGFEREKLATRFPPDTLGYLSIRHIRKAGIAFATDEQLQASVNVIQAIAKTISDAATEDAIEEDVEIDPELLRDLGSHFKTQIAIAALPPSDVQSSMPDIAIASYFYGSVEDFADTLVELARQASSDQVTYRWIEHEKKGITTRELDITQDSAAEPSLPFRLSWAVQSGILYISSHPETLDKLLTYNSNPKPTDSIAEQIAAHKVEQFVENPDFDFYLNSRQSLAFLNRVVQRNLIQAGGLAATFTPQTFVQELGLNEIDSFYLATELTGQRVTYSGIRYANRNGLLATFEPSELSLPLYSTDLTLFAVESLNVSAGQALLAIKDAFLRAAPLANFPYFGIRSKINRDTGLLLEETIANAFQPHLTILQTLDTGTSRSFYGEVNERIVYDFAVKFRLKQDNQLKKLIDSQVPLITSSMQSLAYVEEDTFFIDSDPDESITSGRFALSCDDDYLTIGSGTLKSFEILKSKEEIYPIPDSTNPNAEFQIGNGALLFESLPTTLFRLATVFYLQFNLGKSVPQEYYEFDWAALSTLEQERYAKAYDGKGHLYRISRQRN